MWLTVFSLFVCVMIARYAQKSLEEERSDQGCLCQNESSRCLNTLTLCIIRITYKPRLKYALDTAPPKLLATRVTFDDHDCRPVRFVHFTVLRIAKIVSKIDAEEGADMG